MDEVEKIKKDYNDIKPKIKNKIIFEGLSKTIYNNNSKNFYKTLTNPKKLALNLDNNKVPIQTDKELIKSNESKPLQIMYKTFYFNSDKKVKENHSNKNKIKIGKLSGLSSPFNKKKIFYRNSNLNIFNKNLPKTAKRTNINLYKNIITNYLKQKASDNIPITFPLYLSYNKDYDSLSQKERYLKNLSKLMEIKAHLRSNKTDKFKLINEFMVKNGIKEKKYLNEDNFLKMEKYLQRPINLSKNLTMSELIKNVINNKINKITKNSLQKNEEMKTSNNIKYFKPKINISPKNHQYKNGKSPINNFKKNYSTPNLDSIGHKNDVRISNIGKKVEYLSSTKNINEIIINIENDLNNLRIEKINQIEENNKFNDSKTYLMKSAEDNNKFVPNLCLLSKGFSERYKNNINKYNKKIRNIIQKNTHIKNINKRMYYDTKENKNLKQLELSDIRKFRKITELAVLNRGKQKLLKQNIGKIFYQVKSRNSNLLLKLNN